MIYDFLLIILSLAIVDGLLNNSSLKNSKQDSELCHRTQLLKDIKFSESVKDHTLYLRQRLAVGASQWLAGKNGSLQNLQSVFGYTDEEWQFIWSSMCEKGAWDVPNIKDSNGKVIKENYAPEMFIKYTAHELRCHIIVFDLQLGTIQFCSGNYLKENNVVFHAPLLMYSTGNHFQSVFPINSQPVEDLAHSLESESSTSRSNPSQDLKRRIIKFRVK